MIDIRKISVKDLGHVVKEKVFWFIGSHPRRYWVWLLLVLAILFLFTIILNIYLFIFFNKPIIPVLPKSTEFESVTVNKSNLSEVIEIIDERKIEFESALESIPPPDPSL